MALYVFSDLQLIPAALRLAPSSSSLLFWLASLLLSMQKSNRTGVAVRGAAGNEMAPTARVRGLLNRLPLIGEFPLEGPRFDGLAERELL